MRAGDCNWASRPFKHESISASARATCKRRPLASERSGIGGTAPCCLRQVDKAQQRASKIRLSLTVRPVLLLSRWYSLDGSGMERSPAHRVGRLSIGGCSRLMWLPTPITKSETTLSRGKQCTVASRSNSVLELPVSWRLLVKVFRKLPDCTWLPAYVAARLRSPPAA